MPVKKVRRKYKGKYRTCFKWGDKGKVYCGKDAQKKALRQGRAIHARRK